MSQNSDKNMRRLLEKSKRLLNLGDTIEAVLSGQKQIAGEIQQIKATLAALIQEQEQEAAGDRIMLAGEVVGALKDPVAEAAAELSNYKPATARPMQKQFDELATLNPRLFPVWRQLFENGTRSYYEQMEESCSHWEHKYARIFAGYVKLHGRGRLLDVGCGPHGRPSYLSGWPAEMISGLDPLKATKPVDFELVQGFNEFLPWPDESFHTVVSGTSLDHVLSLDRSLEEVARVMTKNGRYLIWLASIAGAPAFDPEARYFKPIDDFHLFHFDRAWIEPLFEKYFSISDITVIPQPGFSHVFYCLTKQRKNTL